jgi:predicted nucleic acid-binding protein
VPRQVVDELEMISNKSQTDKDAADAVLSLKDELEIHDINPNIQRFDPGENAAIALSEELDAGYFLCDEFTNVMAIHASLGEAQLVTTPNLLKVLFKRDELSKQEATGLLDDMTTARSWEGNSYVKNARKWFESRS